MIVRFPGEIEAGSTSELPWYFADVLPTLAEIANTDSPAKIDGVSIYPELIGNKQDLNNRHMYWEFYEMNGWRAIRFGDWKAVQNDMHFQEHLPIELYNLKDDIGETTNLANQKPEIVKRAEDIFKKAHIPSEHYVWKNLPNEQ